MILKYQIPKFPHKRHYLSLILSCRIHFHSLFWFCNIKLSVLFTINPLSYCFCLIVCSICYKKFCAYTINPSTPAQTMYPLNACMFNAFSIRNTICCFAYIICVIIYKCNISSARINIERIITFRCWTFLCIVHQDIYKCIK